MLNDHNETKFESYLDFDGFGDEFDDGLGEEIFRGLPVDAQSISSTTFDFEEPVYRGCLNPMPSMLSIPSLSPGHILNYEKSMTVMQPFEEPADAPLLPAFPYLVDSTHYTSTAKLGRVVEDITSTLRSHDIDFTFNPLKAKFKATALESNCILDFRIRVFWDASTQHHVIEFLKLQGSSYLWFGLYNRLVADHEPLSSGKSKRAARILPVGLSADFDDLDQLQPSIAMLSSCFAELQSEGVRHLADVSADKSVAGLLLKPGVLNLSSISVLLRSCSVEISAASARLLGNLAAAAIAEPHTASLLVKQVAPSLVGALQSCQLTATAGTGSLYALRACVAATLAVVSLTREAALTVAAAGGVDALQRCVSKPNSQPSNFLKGNSSFEEISSPSVSVVISATQALAQINNFGISV